MDEKTRAWRRSKFRVSAELNRGDRDLIDVRFDTGAQATTVIPLLPEELRQVMDIMEQALKAVGENDGI